MYVCLFVCLFTFVCVYNSCFIQIWLKLSIKLFSFIWTNVKLLVWYIGIISNLP